MRTKLGVLVIESLSLNAELLERSSDDDEGLTLAADIRVLLKAWTISPDIKKKLDEEARRVGRIQPQSGQPTNVVQFPIEGEISLS
jgi:hypothetical protein